MATTIRWAIAQLERTTNDGMVQTCHYTVDAKDEAYSAGAYGSVGLDPADPETMVPFADLSEAQVIDWVQTKLGGPDKVAEIEAALQAQLDEQHTPSKAQGVPWGGASRGVVRARNADGTYRGDDPATASVNEAWTPAA